MRHMICLKLYNGGKLVGEAVSLYLKERVMLRDKRALSKENDLVSTSEGFSSVIAMNQQAYDMQHGSDSGESEDEESVHPLSDDDDLDCGDEQTDLGPLRHGVLPPEIQLLYGVCLAGEGGKAFLATQCIRSVIEQLPQESSWWLTKKHVDTNVSTDSMWIVFHASMTEPLERTAAFAFVADAVQKSGRELDVAHRLVDLFQKFALDLSVKGFVDFVLKGSQRTHSITRHRQNLVLKILVASTRYRVESAKGKGSKAECEATLVDAMDSLSTIFPLVWTVGQDGSVSLPCVDILDCVARTCRLLSTSWSDCEDTAIDVTFFQAVRLISVLSGHTLTLSDKVKRSASDLQVFPFPISWLSDDLATLALRTHNICIANNVSLFSGWESEQFAVHLLRGQGDNFFGVNMGGGIVSGYLPETVENALSYQWNLIHQIVGTYLSFDFAAKLNALRDTDWYKQIRKRYDNVRNKVQIVYNGEDHGLSALISFSCACLMKALAHKGDENNENGKLLFMALSILLPASQFCLNEKLWDSEIGKHVATSIAARARPWQDFSTTDTKNRIPAPSARPGYVRPSKRAVTAFTEGNGEREVFEWFDWEDEADPMSNLIALPLSMIGREWRKLRNEYGVNHAPSCSKELMSRLDANVKKLRASHTAHVIEIVSLRVSSDLLQLAACPDCSNPFLCIQQAAMFAGQAPKVGASDLAFHAKLAKPDACTPLEALLTLGRAESMLSVQFYQEAAFLCNFVANVCSRHRNPEGRGQQDTRWIIVASLAYDLSVMIRILARTVIFEKRLKEDTSGTWDVAAIDELRHARSEGCQWKSSQSNCVSTAFQSQPTYTATVPCRQSTMVRTLENYGCLTPTDTAMPNLNFTEAVHDVTVPIMDNIYFPENDAKNDLIEVPKLYAV